MILVTVPSTIVKKGQKIIFHLKFFVFLTYKVVHIDVWELKVNVLLQIHKHLIQNHLRALLDDFTELYLKLVFDEWSELANKLIDDVREFAALKN